jgi:hypothetical protein
MTECCSPEHNPATPRYRHACPVNGKVYTTVSTTTIKHHIREPWKRTIRDQGYYFCTDPECNVVYFGEDNTVIEKTSLRTQVGIKEQSDDALVCYCYGITRADAREIPQAKAFVLRETKLQTCACETRNPSGRCCLAEFAKTESIKDSRKL